jgi:acetoin utilization deacetylase AcuC-like enzyme
MPAVNRALSSLDSEGIDFDLCIYNAGMDPYENCSTGGLNGITREVLTEREKEVFAWCKRRSLPIAFVLAGGYLGRDLDQPALVELHRLTLAEAVSSPQLAN